MAVNFIRFLYKMSGIKHQNGISLLETLLSLVIISVILVIVANYYFSQNQLNLNVSKANTQIHQLASVAYEWQTAQQQNDFTGLSMAALQTAGLLPFDDPYSQINPWGGSISISPYASNPTYLQITLSKIPVDACKNLRNRMANIAYAQTSDADCSNGQYQIAL